MYGEYHFHSDPVDETTPHLHCDFVPLTKRNHAAKDVMEDKKKIRRTQEKFLEAMQEGCLALNLHTFGAGES